MSFHKKKIHKWKKVEKAQRVQINLLEHIIDRDKEKVADILPSHKGTEGRTSANRWNGSSGDHPQQSN
jgi:transposase